MAAQRIDKLLTAMGLCSRREAAAAAKRGAIVIDGAVCRDASQKVDPETARICFCGQTVSYQTHVYLMMHKPLGVLSATEDREQQTVLDLLPASYKKRGVFPIGRLDKDTSGLLLLTDDGAFANLLTHPSGGVGKLYRVTVRPRATEEQVVKMSSGVVLDDGVKTQPAVIHVVVDEPGRTVLEITLHEGRNRQIRRMCEAVGLEVIRLKRSAEGPVKLGMLQPGEYRELKKSEISALRNAALKAAPARKAAPAAARRPGPIKHD